MEQKIDARCGIAVFFFFFLFLSSVCFCTPASTCKSNWQIRPVAFVGAGLQWSGPYKKSEKGAEPPSPRVLAAGQAGRTAEEEAASRATRQENDRAAKQGGTKIVTVVRSAIMGPRRSGMPSGPSKNEGRRNRNQEQSGRRAVASERKQKQEGQRE